MDPLTPEASAQSKQEELIAHGDVLFGYALARVGDRQTAEDLVQETLVTAIGKLPEFAGRSSLKTWLIGILRHKILDHYRWRERHPADQPSADTEDTGGGDDPWFTAHGAWRKGPNAGLERLDENPADSVERSQLRAALQACVDHLPKSLHRVYVLRELEELAPEEVCATLGIARESLSVMIYRARQALRACLQKKWGEA